MLVLKMHVNIWHSDFLCKCKLLAEFQLNKLWFLTVIYENYVNIYNFIASVS